jgi:Bacterial TSP3 repeat
MSKSLVVSVLALACLAQLAVVCLAQPASSAAARDRDRDGLADRWERRHGLSLTRKSAGGDPDRDRLRNRREYRLRLNPRRADTDRDGLRDRAELVRWRTNPRRADTDRDGFKDGAEVRAGTNPRKRRSHPDRRRRKRQVPSPAPGAPAPPASGGFPSPASTGVPEGWTPAQTRSSGLTVTTPGAVVQDVLFANGADLVIAAPNVTVRRVKLEGGWINNNPGSTCGSGLLIEDVSITRTASGVESGSGQEGVISYGGYTARRVEITNRSEGFRSSSCGPVTIEDSFARIVRPDVCGDWHGDGIQGYDSTGLTVRNVTIDFIDRTAAGFCGGTAPFFYWGHDNPQGRANVDRLLVKGAGYPFRLTTPGRATGVRIVDKSWIFGPISVKCSLIGAWDAKIVTIDSNYQVTSTVRDQPCNTQSDS